MSKKKCPETLCRRRPFGKVYYLDNLKHVPEFYQRQIENNVARIIQFLFLKNDSIDFKLFVFIELNIWREVSCFCYPGDGLSFCDSIIIMAGANF